MVLLALLVAPLGTATVQAQDAQAAAVRQAAEEVLATRFPERADRMAVRVRRLGGDIDGAGPLQLQFPQRGHTPEGPTQVRVRVQTDGGRWTETGWALLDIAHYDSVLTLRSRLRAGDPVRASHLETAWIETTDLRGEPLRTDDRPSEADDAPLIATRILEEGRVVRQTDVRPPYAVDTGASVELYYARGRIAFRLTCKAREPGFAGDAVRVYCPDTRATYRARLADDGRAARWIETL